MSKRYFRVKKDSQVEIDLKLMFQSMQEYKEWLVDLGKQLGMDEVYEIRDNTYLTPKLLGFGHKEKPDGYKQIRKTKGVPIYYPKVTNKAALELIRASGPSEVKTSHLNKITGFTPGLTGNFSYAHHPMVKDLDGIYYIVFSSAIEGDADKKPNLEGGMEEIKEWEFMKALDEHKEPETVN